MFQPKKAIMVLPVSLLSIAVGVIGVFIFASNPAVAQKPCPTDLSQAATRAEQELCAAEKETRLELELADAYATAEAAPASDEQSPPLNPATPEPEGFVKDVHGEEARPLTPDDFAEDPSLRGKESVWLLGNSPHPELGYSSVAVWADVPIDGRPAQIGLTMLNGGPKAYNRAWDLPSPIQDVTITGVANIYTGGVEPEGQIFLTDTTSGLKGVFDLRIGTLTLQ